MKRHFKLILICIVLLAGLLYTMYATGIFEKYLNKVPTEKELLANVPQLDTTKYNRFMFTLDIDVGNKKGDGKEFTESGALELYNDISHLYNQDIYFAKSGYKTKAESWTDFNTKEQYKDLGFGDGWVIGTMKTEEAIDRLVDVINNRNTDRILTMTDSTCTLSWRFNTDIDYLFGKLMSYYTEDLKLSGYGRATAVFDPKTYKFQYFTFIISASNSENAGAMLDSIFYWEVINDSVKGLSIPSSVVNDAYTNTTGVTQNGGYDSIINPIAENLIDAYGGTAETTHDKTSSSLFWTNEENGISATINYIKTDESKTYYKEHYEFLFSFYGNSAEETENEAYFYDSESGELTYIANVDDWYAEIIITGQSGTSQGDLRKSLITYKSKLDI